MRGEGKEIEQIYENPRAISFDIPDGVTSIEKNAFRYCTDLTNITFPHGVANIGYGAFYYCSNLKTITVPDSVTHIGEKAFSGCAGLTDIAYQGTREQWNAISKGPSWDDRTGAYTIHCTDGDVAK